MTQTCPGGGIVVERDVPERRPARGRAEVVTLGRRGRVSRASGKYTRCPACNRRLLAKVRTSCSEMCGCGLVDFVVHAHKPKTGRTAENIRARAERARAQQP